MAEQRFKIVSPFQPAGDQPKAISELTKALNAGKKHLTLLGATGTGKSLDYDEPILIYTSATGEGARLLPIGQLVEEGLSKLPTRVDPYQTEICYSEDGFPPCWVPSFNPQTGTVSLKKVTAFLRHRAPCTMYEVSTSCGRRILLTGDHNLWVRRGGHFHLIKTEEATIADEIPLPAGLPEPQGGNLLTGLSAFEKKDPKNTLAELILPCLTERKSLPYEVANQIGYALLGMGVVARFKIGEDGSYTLEISPEEVAMLKKYSTGYTEKRSQWPLKYTQLTRVNKIENYAKSYVYDISVEENETFLAGFGGLLVHNTYTMAKVIEELQRPTIVMAHNKTLAAQLCSEFRELFPHNAVHYFISYYDYYQPEAYIPQTDLYIEKDASINDEIDRLRHAATSALFERKDVLIVASVSCIYGLGSPEDYVGMTISLKSGEFRDRDNILRRLVGIQYTRNDIGFKRGTFRVRGDVIEIIPAYGENVIRIEFFGDEVDRILELDPITGEVMGESDTLSIYPASHFVTSEENMKRAIVSIEQELEERLAYFKREGMLLEYQRLQQRTLYDLEMMKEVGYCQGIENYSRHLAGREPGSTPTTLLDYFPKDFLLFIDESHQTIPQIKGMYNGDRSRKEVLVNYGFRLPSAFDNRPLIFHEFENHINQVIYVSATPGPYEMEKSEGLVELIIRPTGLIDPVVEVKPVKGQIDDLLYEIGLVTERGERVLVTTLTKRMSEDLTDYLSDMGVKVRYLHSEIKALERMEILRDLRLGEFDVLVGINLLREGLDLPEVSLVAILDADKEGFLRSSTSLIQTIGRAARNVNSKVIMYADTITESMQTAINETNRRREIQIAHNRKHGITPETIKKRVYDVIRSSDAQRTEDGSRLKEKDALLSSVELAKKIKELEDQMFTKARNLEFEEAAKLRDEIASFRKALTAVED